MRDCSILIIDSRTFLYGWLLCKVGCLIWVFNRYRTLRQFVKIWVGSSQYVWQGVGGCGVWASFLLIVCFVAIIIFRIGL